VRLPRINQELNEFDEQKWICLAMQMLQTATKIGTKERKRKERDEDTRRGPITITKRSYDTEQSNAFKPKEFKLKHSFL